MGSGLATDFSGISDFLEFEAEDADDSWRCAQGMKEFCGWLGIDLDDGDGAFLVAGAAESHVRDIDGGVSEIGADGSDDAGAVVIFHEEEFSGWVGFHVVSGDVDDACGGSEEGSGDGAGFIALDGGDFDELGAVGGEGDCGFRDAEAVRFGDGGSVDEVDLRLVVGTGEVSGEDLAGDELGVQLRNGAEVGDADAVALRRGDFGEELAERICEVEVGADAFESAAVEVGHVDRVDDFSGEEEIFHLVSDFDADVFLGFCGGGSEVRSEDALFGGEEWEICRWGFDFVNVEGDSTEVAGVDGCLGRGFIDESAAGAVDDEGTGVHQGDALRIKDVLGFRGERNVECDDVCAGEGDGGAFCEFHFQGLSASGGEERIVSDDRHAKGLGAFCEFGADAAHAEDSEAFAKHFDALE